MFRRKGTKKALLGGIALLTGLALVSPYAVNASALVEEAGGKFYTDYNTRAEALAAADELNAEISAEGNVLLKNDGTLPLFGDEKISVFGRAQDNLTGGSGTLTAALREEGFKVNPALERFYANDSSAIGAEPTAFGNTVSSFDFYHDAAVVILSRTGGEGADAATVLTEKEDNKDGNGVEYDWEHAALSTDENGTYKHYLQLTDKEEELISFVKANFNRIIVVLNTSNAMEMANLQEDEAINAILWIGRPGSSGLISLARILNGKVNPSGKMVDEWYRDFSADPTWYNFGGNAQVGSTNIYNYADGTAAGGSAGGVAGDKGFHGIDYEEDIYLGYRYYETVYAELQAGSIYYNKTTHKLVSEQPQGNELGTADEWWNYAVVYPFGYGLSYTEFDQELTSVYYYDGASKTSLDTTVSPELFNSEKGKPAKVETLYATVKVTNTGSVAGKEVVQIYVTSPYIEGEVEKAALDLVGYGKSHMLRPGQSETVTVSFNVQDFAAFDYDDKNGNDYRGYELDEGTYTIKVMADSHRVLDSQDFTISGDEAALLKIDDFSHNEILPLFSNGDTFDTLRINERYITDDLNVMGEDMTLLSRADMVGTFPKAPTKEALTMTENFVKSTEHFDSWDMDDTTHVDNTGEYYYLANEEGEYDEEAMYPWYKTDEELKTLMEGWTQHAPYADGEKAEIKFREMMGVAFDDPKWDEFLNQITWAEMVDFLNHGSHTIYSIPSVEKDKSSDENGPNSYNGKTWCDETVVSSTWNLELARQYGIINANLAMFNNQQGWYGPGMDIHRSPFAGRNNEYYSQDGLQGGYMAAAVVGGAQSRGLTVWIKHMFLNDQETHRNQRCLFTWTSEAAIRQTYAKCFQMAMQEGGSSAAMTAFARLGRVPASANYNMLTRLARDEWGWVGCYVTDAWAGLTCAWMDIALRTGNDLPDGTASGTKAVSGTWDATAVGVGTSEKPSGTVKIGETESLLQWYYARTAAHRVLYVAANSHNVKNGVNISAYKVEDATVKQGVAANISVGLDAAMLNGNEVVYSATGLPAGLSVNASTGVITGTATQVGTYAVKVTASIAGGWISATTSFNLTIASAFDLDGELTYDVGDEVEIFINSDVVTSTKYSQGITYSISDGALPDGVTLENDVISGTAEKAGEYTATIKVEGKYRSGRKTVTDTYYLTVSITVNGEGGAQPTEVQFRVNEGKLQYSTDGEAWNDVAGAAETGKTVEKFEIDDQGHLIVTYSDQTTADLGNVVGADGADGADGAKGDKGDKGDKGEKGDKGDTGATGPAGADGKDGADGAPGKDGADGKDGKDAEGGCGGVIGAGSAIIAAIAILGAGAVVLKKKHD